MVKEVKRPYQEGRGVKPTTGKPLPTNLPLFANCREIRMKQESSENQDSVHNVITR